MAHVTPEKETAAQQAAVAAQVLRPAAEGATASPEGRWPSSTPHSHGGDGRNAARTPAGSHLVHTGSFDVEDFEVPTGREEQWRFTPVKPLGVLFEGTASDAHLDWSSDLPDGVQLRTVEPGEELLRTVPKPVDRISAQAMAGSGGAALLSVPKETELSDPVKVRLTGSGELVWGHLVIEVEPFAKATVVLEHTGTATYGAAVSVLVGDGAQLELISVQDWDAGSVHAAHYGIRLGRDARVGSTQVSFGGDLVRVVETVEYAGSGGDADLRGLYFADAGQHLEHRLFVDHSVPHCRSRVAYKGALAGDDARTVWVGDVLIRAGAEATDTYELNRNLVLTDGARADSVPNLEIETGEVTGAGHASATGRFDDEQLFYLQSRGIGADEARRLVVRGFFADLVGRIGVPEVADRLLATVDRELEQNVRQSAATAGAAAGERSPGSAA